LERFHRTVHGTGDHRRISIGAARCGAANVIMINSVHDQIGDAAGAASTYQT